MTVALKRKQTKKDLQKITKIRPFINQYEWKDINFRSLAEDWKKLETNNQSINQLLSMFHSFLTNRKREDKHIFNKVNQSIQTR